MQTETETYWGRMQNGDRDVLESYAKPRPRRTGIVSETETETETVGPGAPTVRRHPHLTSIALEPL